MIRNTANQEKDFSSSEQHQGYEASCDAKHFCFTKKTLPALLQP
jgi:hypothetical protein